MPVRLRLRWWAGEARSGSKAAGASCHLSEAESEGSAKPSAPSSLTRPSLGWAGRLRVPPLLAAGLANELKPAVLQESIRCCLATDP